MIRQETKHPLLPSDFPRHSGHDSSLICSTSVFLRYPPAFNIVYNIEIIEPRIAVPMHPAQISVTVFLMNIRPFQPPDISLYDLGEYEKDVDSPEIPARLIHDPRIFPC